MAVTQKLTETESTDALTDLDLRRAGMVVAVTVIIPVYNDPLKLVRCVTAVESAGVADMEIIVADDASTDETPEVAQGLGVRYCRLERNSGPGGARNFAVARSRGAIIIFVDADVLVSPGSL